MQSEHLLPTQGWQDTGVSERGLDQSKAVQGGAPEAHAEQLLPTHCRGTKEQGDKAQE